MANPNPASSQALVLRRGKERAGGRKKRLSTLKKILLRERSEAAAAASAASAASAPSPAPAPAPAPEPPGRYVHLARGHVYCALAAGDDGRVRLELLAVEAASSDESDSDGDSSDADGASDTASADEVDWSSEDGEEAPPAGLSATAAVFVPASLAAAAGPARCALCGVSCTSAADWAQHAAGRAHQRRAAAAARPAPGPSAQLQPPAGYVGNAQLRYGRQVISAELNAAAAALLSRLLELQARARAREPLKAKARQRVVFGLRECGKALRARRAKALLLAPNLEASAAEGSLDEALGALLAAARDAGVPVVLALTRAKLGAATGRPRTRMSCAALLDGSGCEEGMAELLRRAEEGRAAWRAAHPEAAPEEGPAAAGALQRMDRYGRLKPSV